MAFSKIKRIEENVNSPERIFISVMMYCFWKSLSSLQIFHAIPSPIFSRDKRRAVWGENRLKAERAWFLTGEVRRAKPETEPLLTRWGKSCVFSESTGLSFLRHTRRPTLSDSLEGRFVKAKSSRSLEVFPKTVFIITP